MKIYRLSLLVNMLLSGLLFSQTANVLRVGGAELAPYGYGEMVTQPHHQLDSTNADFANYYAKNALWIGAETQSGELIVTCPRLASIDNIGGYTPVGMYHDTTNILGVPNEQFTTISIYEDTLSGWRVEQYIIATNDHSVGLLMYYLHYNGDLGKLKKVYAGVHFDFDVPNSNNHPSSEDDYLVKLPNGYRITDSGSAHGIEVIAEFAPRIQHFWTRPELPETAQQLYDKISKDHTLSPADTADYHFFVGSGPFIVKADEGILLIYQITLANEGLSKSNATDLRTITTGVTRFSRGKLLAEIDKSTASQNLAGPESPNAFHLHQNYPNPFNPDTQIRFDIPAGKSGHLAEVKLEVYSISGQKVATLLQQPLGAGIYEVTWNGRNQRGQQVSSGIYIYRLETPNFRAQKKMLLVH